MVENEGEYESSERKHIFLLPFLILCNHMHTVLNRVLPDGNAYYCNISDDNAFSYASYTSCQTGIRSEKEKSKTYATQLKRKKIHCQVCDYVAFATHMPFFKRECKVWIHFYLCLTWRMCVILSDPKVRNWIQLLCAWVAVCIAIRRFHDWHRYCMLYTEQEMTVRKRRNVNDRECCCLSFFHFFFVSLYFWLWKLWTHAHKRRGEQGKRKVHSFAISICCSVLCFFCCCYFDTIGHTSKSITLSCKCIIWAVELFAFEERIVVEMSFCFFVCV
jgi:hypothetical protein